MALAGKLSRRWHGARRSYLLAYGLGASKTEAVWRSLRYALTGDTGHIKVRPLQQRMRELEAGLAEAKWQIEDLQRRAEALLDEICTTDINVANLTKELRRQQ